jgi:hypothetical protein
LVLAHFVVPFVVRVFLGSHHGNQQTSAKPRPWPIKSSKRIAETIAACPALHVVVIRTSVTQESSERRRRKCLERMLYELDAAEVGAAVLESRGRKPDLRDLQMVNVLRIRNAISARLRVDHIEGPGEPALWVADCVAGAVGAHRIGTAPQYFEHLAGVTDIVLMDAET